MIVRSVLDLLIDYPPVQRLAALTSAPGDRISVVAPAPTFPFVDALIAQHAQGNSGLLIVTATGREAEDVSRVLSELLPEESIVVFPSWETLPHERLSPSTDTVGQRTAILRRLAHPIDSDPLQTSVRIVVTSVRAALQPFASDLPDHAPCRINAGDTADLNRTVERLVLLGYDRVDLVERRGQVAVRGGILDVFPPTEEHALRLEFWGDSVEEIRHFAVSDQRSLDAAPDGLFAPPVRELILTPEVRERAALLAESQPVLHDMCDAIAQGITSEGMESLAPVLASGMRTLRELMPQGTQVVIHEPERVRTRASDVVRTAEEFLSASWHTAALGSEAPIDLAAASYQSLEEFQDGVIAAAGTWWEISPFAMGDADIDLGATPIEAYRGDAHRAIEDLRREVNNGVSVLLLAEGHGSAQRLSEELTSAEVATSSGERVGALQPRVVTIGTSRLEHGFAIPAAGLLVLTETDISGQRSSTREMRKLPSRRRRTIDPLSLASGDYVVHEQHGVGRYLEMIRRNVAGSDREYLLIEYAPSKRGQPADRLFVPMDQLDLITRYVGGEAPSVHRLGGADWTKAKGRARKAVKQMAGELIRLYAARQVTKGYAFGPDTPWQAELEDAFPYAETPDQLSCIDEVKADMERQIPMDRLICGDVGYGKTEIAVRAAFKAVQDGKQVAVLVPTTLLVQQHLSTFAERFGAFPVTIAGLSRFSTEQEVKKTLEGLSSGAVDVVIGTHRLLTPNIRFKDLGLVVVDEEQRFGVEHKEHLKALRTNVDVLAMSATPIPRTLEMAVTGIREMSVIQTPPEERHPVLTFVGPYDERQVTAAIRREILRDGQVFFVHNRVESIDRVAAKIRDLIPEARVAVAHGQMNEHALEEIIVNFWDKEIDVLVCTTIVESGIDIANANTLIVDRADTFGLSQLHQLRGRVGRGRERAYAYFLYDPSKPLTETAHERLATIAQRTDLGSGMQIALKDLEIRGAGNMLGGEQSGHIADVGFDLYIRLVGEALAEHKGESVQEVAEVRVELPITAHIPEEFVPQERLRLEAYKRLADAAGDADVDEVVAELVDRYGALPEPVMTLIAVARLRVHARSAGLSEIVLQGTGIRLGRVELAESASMRLTRLYPKTQIKPAVRTIVVPRPSSSGSTSSGNTGLGGTPLRDTELLAWVEDLITAIMPITPS